MKCVLGRASLPLAQVSPEITIQSQGAVFPSEDPTGRPFQVHQQGQQGVFIHCHFGTDLWPGLCFSLSSSCFLTLFMH